jgi:hypothetical protein
MPRLPQFLLVVCLLADCWLAMQVVHELGHVLGAWWTGGTVTALVLLPWTFSRTDVGVNPSPLVVTWAGPAIGSALPLVMWSVALLVRWSGAYLLRFFAGFCLVANGAYIGGGALFREGDAGLLQIYGTPSWPLFVFGVLAVASGLWLWHRQGNHFGFGGAGGKVDPRAIWGSAAALVVIVGAELLCTMARRSP